MRTLANAPQEFACWEAWRELWNRSSLPALSITKADLDRAPRTGLGFIHCHAFSQWCFESCGTLWFGQKHCVFFWGGILCNVRWGAREDNTQPSSLFQSRPSNTTQNKSNVGLGVGVRFPVRYSFVTHCRLWMDSREKRGDIYATGECFFHRIDKMNNGSRFQARIPVPYRNFTASAQYEMCQAK